MDLDTDSVQQPGLFERLSAAQDRVARDGVVRLVKPWRQGLLEGRTRRLVACTGALLTLTVVDFMAPGHRPGSALAATGPTCTVGASGADYTRIQDAVDNARCATINVAAGTYNENIKIMRSVTIIGADQRTTIVDGSAGCRTINDCTVFTIGQPVTVTLSELTIQNGFQGYDHGGGSAMQDTTDVTIQHCLLVHNRSVYGGGGVSHSSTNGRLTVRHSTFTGNWAAELGAAPSGIGLQHSEHSWFSTPPSWTTA